MIREKSKFLLNTIITKQNMIITIMIVATARQITITTAILIKSEVFLSHEPI